MHIMHIDMDAFFASIEQLDHPELRGKPVLVGSDRPRGVVTTASYEARPFGCRSAQPMAVAKRMCPQAIVVPVRGERYRQVSQQLRALFDAYSPLVEPISIDEITALLEAAPGIRLQGSADEGFATAVTHAAGKDEVFVSRLRRDHTHPRGVNLWVVCDNLRKGAALNAVQILEAISNTG